jgi:hypothetical protein
MKIKTITQFQMKIKTSLIFFNISWYYNKEQINTQDTQ